MVSPVRSAKCRQRISVAEIDLLRSLPKTKRNVQARAMAKTPERIAASREFGYEGYRGDWYWTVVEG